MFQRPLKSYKGYSFDYDFDIEPEENCKTTHYIVHPDAKREFIDFSPYFNCSQAAFEAWIDLGFPPAREFGYQWAKQQYHASLN